MPSSPGFAVLVGPPLVVDSDCCCCCLRLSLVLLVLFQVDQRLGRAGIYDIDTVGEGDVVAAGF